MVEKNSLEEQLKIYKQIFFELNKTNQKIVWSAIMITLLAVFFIGFEYYKIKFSLLMNGLTYAISFIIFFIISYMLYQVVKSVFKLKWVNAVLNQKLAQFLNADSFMLIEKQERNDSHSLKQLQIMDYLHEAVKNNEFEVRYQPIVELRTKKIVAAEILLRWENSLLGIVPPEDFIPLAEANGSIISLGEWVLKQACVQARVWQKTYDSDFTIAVNLSAKQLEQMNIVAFITDTLKEAGLKPQYLELELTERAAFKEAVAPVLKEIKRLGLKLSIDDFGTGYSGLLNLKSLNIDKLKIDRSFIADVCTDANSQAIVSSVINLSKKMNIVSVAEGVESKGQYDLLNDYGCDLTQGYYHSAPLTTEDFTKLLGAEISLH